MVRPLSCAGLQDLDVGCGSRAPELDIVSPDRLEDG
jgi:hypothetical protein